MSANGSTPKPTRTPHNAPGTPEKILRALGGLAGVITLIAATLGAVLAIAEGVSAWPASIKVWLGVLCLLTVAIGAAFAAAIAIGKLRDTAAMTLFVAGGTAAVGGVLADTDLLFRLAGRAASPNPTVVAFGIEFIYFAAACLALGATMLAVSVLIVVVRAASRTLPRLAVGVGLLAALAGAALAVVRLNLASGANFGGGPAGAALLAGASAFALILAVLVTSVAVHLILSALTIGIEVGERRAFGDDAAA